MLFWSNDTSSLGYVSGCIITLETKLLLSASVNALLNTYKCDKSINIIYCNDTKDKYSLIIKEIFYKKNKKKHMFVKLGF